MGSDILSGFICFQIQLAASSAPIVHEFRDLHHSLDFLLMHGLLMNNERKYDTCMTDKQSTT
jgi:hypothetical protein